MLQSRLIGETYKEWPTEAKLKSHGLLLKGGYVRQVSSGIYTLLPLAKRVKDKIENIVREEMNAIDAQEILMPLVSTKKLWDMSGRYDSVGAELLRFKDRSETEMVLSMTHEEIVVLLGMTDAKSYLKYPFSVYQIQTKFRDEARARGGLIRLREFTMKDAYSFHRTEESLNEVYDKYFEAYHKIFARVGVPEVISVASDTGMMGGSGAHEYMLLCDAGEDKIVVCKECNYSANMEVAYTKEIEVATKQEEILEKIYTPNIKTIDELVKFTGIPATHMLKAVIYTRLDTKEPVVVFIRADRDVNESKLTNLLKADVEPRKVQESDNIACGFVGPKDLMATNATVIFDKSLENEQSIIAGANEIDYHYKGLNIKRDVQNAKFVDVSKVKIDDVCPICGKKELTISNGIEVGNIFKLGTKYTKSMGMTYIDEDGKEKNAIMGCYGIGMDRLIASVLEVKATERCTNWPASIAPYEIHICPLDYEKSDIVKEETDKIYNTLQNMKFDVLLDDRAKSPGNKFADADLIGAPIRIVVSNRNLPNKQVEVKITGNEAILVEIDKLVVFVENTLKELKK